MATLPTISKAVLPIGLTTGSFPAVLEGQS
jgi:hypothetical protein